MKIGDTVRIKTSEELEEVGIDWKDWDDMFQDLIGKEVEVTGLSDGGIYVNNLMGEFYHNEYVLVDNEIKRGDIVYVSDVSEKDAEKQKEERIFLTYVKGAYYPYICVTQGEEEEFHTGEPFNMKSYAYTVKKPTKKKLTKKELISYLEEHGLELED